jgi:predicted HD phosphohydrolase
MTSAGPVCGPGSFALTHPAREARPPAPDVVAAGPGRGYDPWHGGRMGDDVGRMNFRRMDEGTDADFAVLKRVHEENLRQLPDLLMGLLTKLRADDAYPVDRLEHSLQAATRALRDGRDEEYVVCTLLHDIGESLGPFNHGDVAAAVLAPFVSEANRWMLEHHPVFQVYFYASHLGIDPNARDRYRESPFFDRTAEFCARYDEVSFDRSYPSEPMSTFAPMVRRVLLRPWTPPT